jgi:EpsD family peptidyl-prolyl cis-trans isomerase
MGLRAAAVLGALCGALVIGGCGGDRDKGASQTAAKVNKEEITVHQINFYLQQQRGLRPEQAEAASRQVLERLIDQELAVQKADELKLDRDPRVVQQLEAVRREVLARAYAEKVGEAATRPTAEEVKKYYEDNPDLFSQRRIYSLQEITIEATPDQVSALRTKLGVVKSISEFVDFLKESNLRFTANQAVRAAEQLPLSSLKTFAGLSAGQAVLNETPTGAQVIVVAGVRSQPVAEEQSRPAIEQFLLNERKRKLLEQDREALRASATVQYVGKFAEAAAAASAPGGAKPPSITAPLPSAPPASGGLDPAAISKGMGLK